MLENSSAELESFGAMRDAGWGCVIRDPSRFSHPHPAFRIYYS
jgi:hypothetical protein